MTRGTRDFLSVFAAVVSASLAAIAGCGRVGDDSRAGQLTLEPATPHSVGVRWVIHGDADRDAVVGLMFRKTGAPVWNRAPDLTRLETDALQGVPAPPHGAWVFTGTVRGLDADTEYELRLALADPDGAREAQVLRARTLDEPPPAASGDLPPR